MSENDTLLLKCARESIYRYLSKQPFYPSFSYQEVQPVNGVFVTLWKKTSVGLELRGCIGRHNRKFANLADEIADCAIESAIHDPRFEPVSTDELSLIKIEISLLSSPTPIHNNNELNPQKFGVIVKQGFRQATLLPDIEGIDTIDEQLRIVKNKAGILNNDELKIYKFEVKKIKEEDL